MGAARTARIRVAAALLTAAAAIRSAQAAEPPNARFQHWTVEDGLSQSTVNAIAQDAKGFMWFGTQDGLNRFDGQVFAISRNRADDPGSLPAGIIWSVLTARDGTIWIGIDGGGITRFDPVSGRLSPGPKLPGARVRSLAEGPDGTIWVGIDGGGLAAVDPKSGTVRGFRHDASVPSSLASDAVRVVLVDRAGSVWIGTDGGGLDRLAPAGGGFVHLGRHDDPKLDLGSDRIRALLEDRDGHLWIGTYDGGLSRLNPVSGEIRRFTHRDGDPRTIPNDRVRTLLEDNEGTIWAGTDAGLARYDRSSGGFDAYRHDPSDPRSLGSDRVLSLYQDRGGVLWVATQAGLSTWNPTIGSFAHVRQQPDSPASIGSNVVTSFAAEPGGAVWVGTFGGGLDRLERDRSAATHYRHVESDPGSLSDDRVMSLLRDRAGHIWVGTMAGGLNRLDPATGRFERFASDPADPHGLPSDGVTALYEDPAGRIWIGAHNAGLCRYDAASKTFARYRSDPANRSSLSDDRVMSIAGDSSGTIWVGTEGGGINGLDPATGRFVRFAHDAADPASLASNVVWSILEGRDGTLWIGTQAGLSSWSRAHRRAGRGVFRSYTVKDGLPNDFVYAVLEDAGGALWMSTNRGIARFDPATDRFVSFDSSYGLQSNEFNFGAALKAPGGTLYFGGNNGFNAFDPLAIHPNTNVPPVVVTGILRFDEPLPLPSAPWASKRITAGYRDYALTFEFASLDYTAPKKNRLQFRLEGFDAKWIDPGTSRRATYTNLPPGEYVFRVRGSNAQGVWNEAGASVAVHVLPPPWRTGWAYLAYALLAGGVGAVALNAQRRKIRLKAEYTHALELQVQERTAEIAQRSEALAIANAKLQEASLTDPLTGLRNRRYLMTQLQNDLSIVDRAWSERAAGRGGDGGAAPSFVFFAIDLDGFKPINDRYGHEAGDRILCAVRDALLSASRAGDVVLRLGGDEFLVVCRHTDRVRAPAIAERLLDAIVGASVQVEDGTASVGGSVGFALYPFSTSRPSALSWERVLAVADKALYLAKEGGRRAWVGITCNERALVPGELADILADPNGAARQGIVSIASSSRRAEPHDPTLPTAAIGRSSKDPCTS